MKQHDALLKLMHQLQEFKKKFYLNLLLRGSLFAVGLLLSVYIIYSLLEYLFYFPQAVRAILLFSFIGIALYVFIHWIAVPLSALANLKKLLSDEQAAQRIGQYYPEIKDKLLNAIQLDNLDRTNELIAASIEQRSSHLTTFRFKDAVTYKENKPLLKYIALPTIIALLIAWIYPVIFVQGTERIIHYKTYYAPVAPFTFVVENDKLQTYRGEDFVLQISIEGKTIPKDVFINYNGRRQKLTSSNGNFYTYTFKQPQRAVNFQLEGSGFMSEEYNLQLLSRPNLKDFRMQIQYPAYLKREAEVVQNTGNATVPEGSTLTWNFTTTETDSVRLNFDNPAQTALAAKKRNSFRLSKKINESLNYSVKLHNEHSSNKEEINYQITTIPDRHPEISIEQYKDTALYSFLVLGGDVSDDYGLTRLALLYKVTNDKAPQSAYKSRALPLNGQQLSQSYYYQWNTAALNLKPGDKLEYFVQVWDNDGIRGAKSARTRVFEFKVPSKADLEKELNNNAESVASQMSKSLEKSTQLKEGLAKSEEKLKAKRGLTWQDKKQLEDLVEKKKQLEQDIASMKELFDKLNKKQNMLHAQDKQLAEKTRELQKLMNDMLDPETKKLYEELEKLLQEKSANDPELQQLMSKLDQKERNLERELERAKELFKQLQFEQKLDNITKNLEELSEEQKNLAQKTDEKKADNKQLQEEQKQIQENFDELKKQMDELEEMNDQLSTPNQMDEEQQNQEEQIEQDMQDSQNQLQKQQNKKASDSQQKAGEKMKQMAQKMEQMESSMSMAGMQQNLDNLRDILENLIKLSHDQEGLMKSFRNVNQSDPRFITLSQQQLSLRDNAKVIEDSLVSLSKKVFQIESFVTREVSQMNQSMDNSMQELKDRNVGKATAQQQLAMTSINNLALMLNDALKQMQQAMQNMQGSMAGKKKGSKPQPGDFGEMQQQLNKKIEELKKGGKTGKALSEELAKLAAEQEALRNALKEMEKQGQKPGEKGQNGNIGNISRLMEQSEADLVNKRLTEQTIMRQREILTRLLEAEKSMKERELDDKREAKTAQDFTRKVPASFDKYIKTKEKQTELLKTVPPALSPYYKQKVNEYFQNMKNN